MMKSSMSVAAWRSISALGAFLPRGEELQQSILTVRKSD